MCFAFNVLSMNNLWSIGQYCSGERMENVRKIMIFAIAIVLAACTGDQGPVGPQGALGIQGTQGIQGVQGEQGELGGQGEQGEQGDQGEQGEQGIQGETGEMLNWADVIEKGNLYDSIYLVGILVDGVLKRSGTGFSAYFSDKLWTNAHVVESLMEIYDDPENASSSRFLFATQTGNTIGGDGTYLWQPYVIHPEYGGEEDFWSPDIALIQLNGEITHESPSFLPREFADDLRIGQPIGTLGFPGLLSIFDVLPLASFKEGTISALRPFYNAEFIANPTNTGVLIHYNLATLSRTSGSPVFDHEGFVIAIQFAGIVDRIRLPDDPNGDPGELLGTVEYDENFGVHISAAWDLLDHLESQNDSDTVAAKVNAGSAQYDSRPYPHEEYQPEPLNWNGETILP